MRGLWWRGQLGHHVTWIPCLKCGQLPGQVWDKISTHISVMSFLYGTLTTWALDVVETCACCKYCYFPTAKLFTFLLSEWKNKEQGSQTKMYWTLKSFPFMNKLFFSLWLPQDWWGVTMELERIVFSYFHSNQLMIPIYYHTELRS